MNPLTEDYIAITQLYAGAIDSDVGTVSGSVCLPLTWVKVGESPRPRLHLQTIYTDSLTREDGIWVLARHRSDADLPPYPSQLGFSKWDTAKGRQV